MNTRRITEAELIDVLLGGADPALEARVRQAVRHDPRVAALYAHWSALLPTLQQGVAGLRPMNERIKAGVMRRLEETPLTAAEYAAGIDPVRWDWIRPQRWMLRAATLAVAALLLAGVVGAVAWQWLTPSLRIEAVAGPLQAVPAGGGAPVAVRAGDRFLLPVRLRAATGTRAEIKLADASRLLLAGEAEVDVIGRRRVRQIAGMAEYRVIHRRLGGLFTVQIPQGTVQDLGTEFRVAVGGLERTEVRVNEGRVRVNTAGGRAVEAAAGQRAVVRPEGARVEPIPPWPELARAREQFKTRLLRRGPAPQSGGHPQGVPPGAREVRYRSGELELKAWISAPPADGRRHPAVVYAHNGFTISPRDWENTAVLRQAGYIVVAPLMRGEGGNPGVFECCWGEVDDLRAAGEYAAGLPEVEPTRIFLIGHDEGGTLATLAAMLPSRFAAVAALDAHTDLTGFAAAAGGTLPFDPQDPAERLVRSPRFFPASLHCPLHLILGEADTALLPGARDLAGEAAELGKACQVWVVPGDHMGALEPGIQACLRLFSGQAPETVKAR